MVASTQVAGAESPSSQEGRSKSDSVLCTAPRAARRGDSDPDEDIVEEDAVLADLEARAEVTRASEEQDHDEVPPQD